MNRAYTFFDMLATMALGMAMALAFLFLSLNNSMGGEWNHFVWIPVAMLLLYAGWKQRKIDDFQDLREKNYNYHVGYMELREEYNELEEKAKRLQDYKDGGLEYIIIWGNIHDGYEFIGPFNGPEPATEYCEGDSEIRDSTWEIALLQKPSYAEDKPLYDLSKLNHKGD